MNHKALRSLPLSEVLHTLSTNAQTGLTSSTAEEIKKVEGLNTSSSPYTLFAPLALVVYLAPLCVLAALLERAGDRSAAIVVLTAGLLLAVGVYGLIHRVLRIETLRAQLRHRMDRAMVTVVRDGTAREISAKLLVPGDVLLYEQKSDTILPADVRLLPGHTLLLGHSWRETHRSGTHVPKSEEFLAAGTELSFASATMVVTATGNNRCLMHMYQAHPAGPLVQAVWSMGWYYLGGSLLLLGLASSVGFGLQATYALAAGTPLLLPYFLMKKGRGLRMQRTHDVPDHLLYPAEELLVPDYKAALTLLGDELVPLRTMKKAEEAERARTAQFLELLDLCIRDAEETRHGALLHKIVMNSKRYGLLINSMEDWTYDPEHSRTVFDAATGTYIFQSSFVQHAAEEEHTLHLQCMDAATILEKSTYMWDEREHTMRRRFFSGEKQRLAQKIATYEQEAGLLYGLALREHAHEDAPLLFIGVLIVPRALHEATMSELVSYAKNGHAVVLYTEGNLPAPFLREKLSVPAQHIFARAEDLTFTGLRRHDLFFVGQTDALALRELHNRLHGGVLVDTHADHFISNLFFWPTLLRFGSDLPSFFSWLRHHTKQARDGMTKSAQYVAMNLTLSLGLLVLFSLQKTAMDTALYLSLVTATLLGVTALFGHFTDSAIRHKHIHTLHLSNVHQAIFVTRMVLVTTLCVGGYLLLSRVAGPQGLEMVYFGLLGLAASLLAKLAEDTQSLRHTLLYAGIFTALALWGYLGLLGAQTQMDGEYAWYFTGAVLLGGITWILASYQSVAEGGSER